MTRAIGLRLEINNPGSLLASTVAIGDQAIDSESLHEAMVHRRFRQLALSYRIWLANVWTHMMKANFTRNERYLAVCGLNFKNFQFSKKIKRQIENALEMSLSF